MRQRFGMRRQLAEARAEVVRWRTVKEWSGPAAAAAAAAAAAVSAKILCTEHVRMDIFQQVVV